MKKTAVEWLKDQLECFGNKHELTISWTTVDDLVEQAKEMHKQEMIDFADNYVDNCVIPNENMAIPTIMDVPNYYNETFGGKDE